MQYKEVYYDEEKGEWVETIKEEDSFGFSTTTNFPIERLKKNNQENKNENEIQENKE